MKSATKKKVIIALAILIPVILTAVFFPYIKAEYLTWRYGEEFTGLERQTNMLNAADYLKVLEYSEHEATVFYASDTGDVMVFVKDENSNWTRKSWKTIWSESGSADGFYWPYYK